MSNPTPIVPLDARKIVHMQDEANLMWHMDAPLPSPPASLLAMVLAQHRENFDLWHEEDKARDPHASDATITKVKHAIDGINQRRNDLVEQIDLYLLEQGPAQREDAPLHSETPGLMIDRLSILALKIFHTEEQTHRTNATAEHRRRNHDRLALLLSQRNDLAGCLDALWSEVKTGRRRFKIYRQLKMYNDPELNPVLYGSKSETGRG
jgi:hypothetical protein